MPTYWLASGIATDLGATPLHVEALKLVDSKLATGLLLAAGLERPWAKLYALASLLRCGRFGEELGQEPAGRDEILFCAVSICIMLLVSGRENLRSLQDALLLYSPYAQTLEFLF